MQPVGDGPHSTKTDIRDITTQHGPIRQRRLWERLFKSALYKWTYLQQQTMQHAANLVLLMFLKQRFSSSNVLGKIVSGDYRLHVMDPADQITVVRQEAVEIVGVFQIGTSFSCLNVYTSHQSVCQSQISQPRKAII